MTWIPKCCESNDLQELNKKFRSTVEIYCEELESSLKSGVQDNRYFEKKILSLRSHVKDRSLAAQDTSIVNSIQDASTSKEFIFKNFNVGAYKFNEIKWSGSSFKVLSVSKLSSVTLDGKRFNSTDSNPFISILAGLKKL